MRRILRDLTHLKISRLSDNVTPSHLKGTTFKNELMSNGNGPLPDEVPDGDVIIATWWETAEWLDRLPLSKGIKVHFMQDYELWGGDATRVHAACSLPFPKITPSKWVLDLIHSELQQLETCHVPNAVDGELFTSPLRTKSNPLTVGFTYTSFAAKGCDLIIEAIRLARLRNPDIRVVCFGSIRPSSDASLPAGTEYSFQVPDELLPRIYMSADVWLFGSKKEGFGLPILEAMACRTPVIGTPAGAAPELLADGRGVLIPMGNPQAMADAILDFAAMSDSEWQLISDAAFNYAHRYTWDSATDRFEAYIRDLAGRNQGNTVSEADPA
jgi:glycosyltransferase involved in cell wall biosynthesis